jgi:hypothetical protein
MRRPVSFVVQGGSGGDLPRSGYHWICGLLIAAARIRLLAAKFDQRLPDLDWREVGEQQRAPRRRVTHQQSPAQRREAAAGRALFWLFVIAALLSTATGHWWLLIGVAVWWFAGLAYVAARVIPIFRRGVRS